MKESIKIKGGKVEGINFRITGVEEMVLKDIFRDVMKDESFMIEFEVVRIGKKLYMVDVFGKGSLDCIY